MKQQWAVCHGAVMESSLDEIYAKLDGKDVLVVQSPGMPKLAVLPLERLDELARADSTTFINET